MQYEKEFTGDTEAGGQKVTHGIKILGAEHLWSIIGHSGSP